MDAAAPGRSPEPLAVEITTDHHAFATINGDWLAADPVHSNVISTVLDGVQRGESTPAGALWITALSAGRPVAAAMHTPPFNLYLPPMPAGAATAVAAALHAAGHRLPGATGGTASTAEFVEAWTRLTGDTARLGRAEGVHVLDRLAPPDGVPGHPRKAAPGDLELCTAWWTAFHQESALGHPSPDGVAGSVAHRIEQGLLMLWDDGAGAVSLAGWHRPAAGVSRVGPVYTPPEQRRHGYAAAVTAAASRAALAAGAARVMLFTDLANPTANGVYARLGYRRVGDASEWAFSARS